jgi:hypothetical protein
MKKFLAIIVLGLLWSGNVYSKIILLNKCYPEKKGKYKSFEDFNKNSKETNFHIYKNFERRKKEEIIKTYNVPFEDILFKISAKSGSAKRIFVITDKGVKNHADYLNELNSIIGKLKKENKDVPFSLKSSADDFRKKKMWSSKPQKISDFYDDKIIYEDKDGRTDLWTLDLKSGVATADTGRKILKMICQVGGNSKSNYLDYWWAVILIIAITFFIFTQSGKRLKQIRRK